MVHGFFRTCRSAMRLAPAGVIVLALAANFSCAPARGPAPDESQPAAAKKPQPQTEPRSNQMAKLEAADALVTVESRSGCVGWLRVGKPLRTVARGRPAALLEVTDLRAGRTYHPMRDKFDLTGWKTAGAAGKKTVTFTQQYEGAPFRVVQKFREMPAGVRWEASLKLLPGDDQCRSLRVAWVLPAPGGWSLWSPQDTRVRRNDGVTPQRYVYGHISFRPYGTMIPLVATWGRQGGFSAFSPPNIQKPYISFDIDSFSAPTPVRGIAMGRDDLPTLRVTHHMVGLRPGKALKLAVCLAGIKPDWRSALASYVNAYPKLFEPVPATRKVEGMYGITNPTRAAGQLDKMKTAGVTFAEVHGHFPEYSIYMTREALKDPKLTWRCKPHPGDKLSLAGNRECIRKLNAAGIAAFMYWYNCHARLATIKKLWPDDLMRDEKGRPMLKWHTEPSIHASPDTPYGKHLMEQMDLLIKAYPKAAGFFVDNYAIEMIDFAHDDGVTMVHNRPAYDMNRNHQTIGPPCFVKAHKAGKIIMVNKISTIESLRGADMVLAETRGVTSIRKHALACVFRPLFPLGMEVPPGPRGPERGFQHLLLNGCFADEDLYHKDPKTADAYRPLTDTMIGKRWVLEFDPLTLAMAGGGGPPDGVEAQIFRIDKAAPKGGSVVVVVADLNGSWKDKPATAGLTVTVRLADRARLKKATWLAVEASGAEPVACKLTRKAKSLTVELPPVGAAGILRLSP